MKNKILIGAIAVSVGLTACQKEVTEIVPNDRLSSSLAFSTPAKMENAVIGAYDGLQNANYLSGRALVYLDLLAEDVYDKGNFFGDLPRFVMLSNNAFPAGVWNAGYLSIVAANRAIAGINANPGIVSAAKAKQLIAECLFVRAVNNFYLVNFFAQPYNFTADASHTGIPIITDAYTSNDEAANKPRATVDAVYNAIIADLQLAVTDLPAAQSTVYATKTRATQAAAAAFLSRVFLYKGNYAGAYATAASVVNGNFGAFALRPTPNGAFGTGNYMTSETIWSIPNSVNDNPNTNNALPQHYSPAGRGDIAVSQSFRDPVTNPYFAADDRRRTTMLVNGTGANAAFFYTGKYADVTTRADWAPIVRYAEIILNYAEALARNSATPIDADAVAKLNMVRDRSRVSAPAYTIASFATRQDLINAILGERRIELAFEGHRFLDLMRTKTSVRNKYDNDGVTILPVQAAGSAKSIFPIPQAEIDKSRGVLTQNAGY